MWPPSGPQTVRICLAFDDRTRLVIPGQKPVRLEPHEMRKPLTAFIVMLLAATTVACSGNADRADEDAVRLAGMVDQAITLASESIENPVLH